MQLFVATFGRAPTPMEASWLVQWSDQISKGEMTMADVGHLFNLSPEVAPPALVEAPPIEVGSDTGTGASVPLDTAGTLNTTVTQLLGRSMDMLTLQQLLTALEDGSANTNQLVLEHALSSNGHPNDRAMIDAKTDGAIDYLVSQGWDGHVKEQATQAVSATQRSDVINPALEPPAELAFTEENWAFFSSLREEVSTFGEAHVTAASVNQIPLLNVLNVDTNSLPENTPINVVYDALLGGTQGLGSAVSYDLHDRFDTLMTAKPGIINNATSYSLNESAGRFENLLVEDLLPASARSLLDGASNREDFRYTVSDSLQAFAKATSASEDDLFAGVDGYRLTDAIDGFANLSLSDLPGTESLASQIDLLRGAENGDQYRVTVADSLESMLAREDTGWLEQVDGYRLTDAADAFAALPVDQALSEEALTLLGNAENGSDYAVNITAGDVSVEALNELLNSVPGLSLPSNEDTPEDSGEGEGQEAPTEGGATATPGLFYSLSDSFETLMNNSQLVEGATKYTLTDAPADLAALAPSAITDEVMVKAAKALIEGATNGESYTLGVSGSLTDVAKLSIDLQQALDTVQLTDAADAFVAVPYAERLSAEEVTTLNNATNSGDYAAYTVVAPAAQSVSELQALRSELASEVGQAVPVSTTLEDSADAITQARADGVDLSGVDLTIYTEIEGTTATGIDGGADRFLIDDDPATSGLVLSFDVSEDTLALTGTEVSSVNQHATAPTDPSSPLSGQLHVFAQNAGDTTAIETLLENTRFEDEGEQTLFFHNGDDATAWNWQDSNDDGVVDAGELSDLVTLVGLAHDDLLQFSADTFA
jgi:hypothetical protein